MTTKDLLLLSHSLMMVEALNFGYWVKFGIKGIKYKFKAIKDGIFSKFTKISSAAYNRDIIFRSLDTRIPLDQLTYSKLDEGFKVIANEIFEISWKLIKNGKLSKLDHLKVKKSL